MHILSIFLILRGRGLPNRSGLFGSGDFLVTVTSCMSGNQAESGTVSTQPVPQGHKERQCSVVPRRLSARRSFSPLSTRANQLRSQLSQWDRACTSTKRAG